MDLEGFTRRRLLKVSRENLKLELLNVLKVYKNLGERELEIIAEAVIEEVERSKVPDDLRWLFSYPISGISMNELGVGSRGEGDFHLHRKLSSLLSDEKAVVSPKDQDDAGVVEIDGKYLVVSVDGTHSRLSEFPFLAGFHVTRAAVRDVFVMGAKPHALLCDLHLADDGEVSKLLDFMGGVSVVSEFLGIPLVAGSTLRIGGDMVIGDRMVSCVGCVGIAEKLTPRRNAMEGDVILMTEGAGGGTITTTAIFSGNHHVALETINLDFSLSMLELLKHRLYGVHALTDVTNGGLRGDCLEISKNSRIDIFLNGKKIEELINEKVLKLLKKLQIDPLGVSIDSLLIIASPDSEEELKRIIRKIGVKIERIGFVRKSSNPKVYLDEKELKPKFRESAYTKIKKIYGEKTPDDFEEMKMRVEEALGEVERKKKTFLRLLSKR
ncbi:MAG: AIR synthase related protein [Candidatus Methanofastidiosia archaeon]